jgi:hypothetical protein
MKRRVVVGLALVMLLLFVGATIFAVPRDPLDRFYGRAGSTQLYLNSAGGSHNRTVVLRLEEMGLDEATRLLAQSYPNNHGWVKIKQSDWRVVYERTSSGQLEYVRCYRALGRPGVNIEEQRQLQPQEVWAQRLRQWLGRV